MKDTTYNYTLQDLLCLRTFDEVVRFRITPNFSKQITEWAEKELLTGNDSESLLILASLNFESHPIDYKVNEYLGRYQREVNIENPSAELSALVWLRIQLTLLMKANSPEEVEGRLGFFTQYVLDYPPPAFASITYRLNNFYWEMYDEAMPAFNSRASSMSDEELLLYVKQWCEPYYRILINEDWLSFLTKRK